jgi:double zinc ribbon protein
VPLALFGITDDGLNLAVNLVILVLVVLWLALAYWTFADARRRIADPILVTTATVLGLVPFLGPLVYTVLRPPEFLEDVREREIETQASELRMRHLVAQSCPRCEHPIERSWLRCPECQHRLKDPCVSCSRPVDPRWSICPYCETQLRRPASEGDEGKRSSRRSSESRSEQRDPKRKSSSDVAPRRRTEKSTADSGSASETRSQRKSSRPPAPESGDGDAAGGEPRPRRRSTTKS